MATQKVRGGLRPPRRLPLAPHGGAVAPQRRKIRYRPEAKPRGDFGRPMRAAIPMLGEFLPLTARGVLMCPILRGKMGLDTPPALGARASEMGGAGGARPQTWFAWFGAGACRGVIGGSAPLPPGLLRGSAASVSEATHGRRCRKLIHRRDDHLRHAETRKKQFAPPTRTKSVFLWGATPVSLGKTKEMGWHLGLAGPCPAPCPPPRCGGLCRRTQSGRSLVIGRGRGGRWAAGRAGR